MDIKEAHIGQKVKIVKEGHITGISDDGKITMSNSYYLRYAEDARCVEPVSDPCSDCQKKLDAAVEYWRAACEEARRNAAYWRDELEKLQKETLAECKPLGETAKIYIQVSPDELNKILKERD